MPTWPVDLPQDFDAGTFNGTEPDVIIETQMDAGPAQRRRRYTAAPEPFTAAMTLSPEELADFRMFFRVDLAGGALSFDGLAHPITKAACIMVYKRGGVSYRDLPAGWCQVGMSLEILP